MPDKAPANDATAPQTATTPAPRRGPGHRGADVRDTVAEMAARAQEISREAGSKMAAAMRDVIGAAAGITGFAIESARDLVQYMVRRGQMTQEEADKLIREAEEAHASRKPAERGDSKGKVASVPQAKAEAPAKKPASRAKKAAATKKPPAKKAAAKAAAKRTPPKKKTAARKR